MNKAIIITTIFYDVFLWITKTFCDSEKTKNKKELLPENNKEMDDEDIELETADFVGDGRDGDFAAPLGENEDPASDDDSDVQVFNFIEVTEVKKCKIKIQKFFEKKIFQELFFYQKSMNTGFRFFLNL